jgi:hypothetical protein
MVFLCIFVLKYELSQVDPMCQNYRPVEQIFSVIVSVRDSIYSSGFYFPPTPLAGSGRGIILQHHGDFIG